MADTPLYTEDWAAGVSDFCDVGTYLRSTDGPDPLYDNVWGAYDSTVSGGKLAVRSGGNATNAGVWFGALGEEDGGGASSAYQGIGWFNANQGYAKVTYTPTSAALGESFLYAPLIALVASKTGAGGGIVNLYWDNFSEEMILQYPTETSFFDEVIPMTAPVADVPYKVEMRWKVGTLVEDEHQTDGFMRIYINDVLEYEATNIALYLTFQTVPYDMLHGVMVGFSGLIGDADDIEVGTWSEAEAVVPPMQRAGYVFFSRAIVEKQSEVRLTRSYLQLLTADPPASGTPVVLDLTEITGNLYDQEGVAITSGRLYIKPRGTLVVSDQLVSASTITYDVTGPLSINIAPSNGTLYDVEFDPDPADTGTPRNLKPGYFKAVWDIPAADTDVADL